MTQLLSIRNNLAAPGTRARAKYAVLYTSGWFVLWLEGSDAVVDEALQRAAADSRNEHQKLLHRSHGPPSLRERVIVASTQTPLKPTQFARWILHMQAEGQSVEPVEIWNRLGAPCLLEISSQPQPRPAQHFAFIADDDHGPVDQLRKLGERYASPVIYQRFGVARSNSPDMGMAYVDVPVQAGAARVRVLSGRAMGRAAVRHSMPPHDALVLLIGNRPEATIQLATHLAQALRPFEKLPKVWLGGATGEPVAACVRLLAQVGVVAQDAPLSGNARSDLPALLQVAGLSPLQGNSTVVPRD